MCTGLEIALALGSTALSTVGSAMAASEQQRNNERQARARNQELSNAMARNKELSQEAITSLNSRVADAAPEAQKEQTQTAQDALVSSLSEAARVPEVDTGISGSAPEVVKTEMAKRLGESLGTARTNAENLGKLGTYGQMMFNNNMANQQTAQDIALPVGLARSNMDILPGLQDLAQISANKPGSGLGQVLQGLGNLGASAAGSGYFSSSPTGVTKAKK